MTVYTYLRSIIIAFGLLLCGAILPFLNATPLLIGKVPSSDDHQQGSTNSIFPHLLLTKTIKDSFKLPSLSKIVGSSCKLPYDAEELNTRLKSDPDTKLNAVSLNINIMCMLLGLQKRFRGTMIKTLLSFKLNSFLSFAHVIKFGS